LFGLSGWFGQPNRQDKANKQGRRNGDNVIDFWDSFIRMASALALVLALMGGLVLLVRRFAGARLSAPVSAQIVQVIGSGYIGPRKTISLVSVAGEFLVVGMTPTELVSLGHITDRERVQQFLSAATVGRSVVSGKPTETGGGHAG
jgi:flagellar protein FliO/FliZ